MYTLISSSANKHLFEQYRDWVEKEWGKASSLNSAVKDHELPSPILAVSNQVLVGGVSFTKFPMPQSEDAGIWINTLYVAPEHRKSGIGSHLVKAAELEARRKKIKELFVYTDMPGLYLKLDWDIVDDTNESTVLGKSVEDC